MVRLGPLMVAYKCKCRKCGYEWTVSVYAAETIPGKDALERCPRCGSTNIRCEEEFNKYIL